MAMTLQELGIDHLAPHEKMDLAWELWNSATEELQNEPLTDEVRAMLEERIREADANPGAGVSWEIVEAEARARTLARRARTVA